jgi:hypothetical protein
MARPKGKLFALLAVFVAIGLATATGAFTTVQADRTATVNVAGDQDALLAFSPVADSDSGDENYVSYSDGQIQFDIDGINTNAETNLSLVFEITNNGEDEVNVWIQDSDLAVSDQGGEGDITFYAGNDNTAIESDPGVTLGSGDSVKVGIKLDVGEVDDLGTAGTGTQEWLDGDLVIYANATSN